MYLSRGGCPAKERKMRFQVIESSNNEFGLNFVVLDYNRRVYGRYATRSQAQEIADTINQAMDY